MKLFFRYFLCGLAMGAADLVPGVSGGTIAYITGIYHKLLSAVKAFDASFFLLLCTLHIKKAFSRIPWKFLLPLASGIVCSILGLARLVLYLLQTWPEQLWAFFFGLIVSSIIILMRGQNLFGKNTLLLILGAAGAWMLTGAEGITASHALPNIFLAGFIALCAMILPGISGSFILLLMGQYYYILAAVLHVHLEVILVFTAGGLCGLISFSRMLSACLNRFPSETNAVLIGIMAGCLRKVWPWHHGAMLSLPGQIDASVLMACTTCLAGIALPLLIQKISHKKNMA